MKASVAHGHAGVRPGQRLKRLRGACKAWRNCACGSFRDFDELVCLPNIAIGGISKAGGGVHASKDLVALQTGTRSRPRF